MIFLSSIKPILFLHYLLVLKTEEQDKSILCMCVYILCICIQYVTGFVSKIVLRCVDISVYTYTVVWWCVYSEGWFWLLTYAWFEYLIDCSCYNCICQFFIKIMCVLQMENVRCCIILFDQLIILFDKLKLISFLCILHIVSLLNIFLVL